MFLYFFAIGCISCLGVLRVSSLLLALLSHLDTSLLFCFLYNLVIQVGFSLGNAQVLCFLGFHVCGFFASCLMQPCLGILKTV
jgi:hypothetical protein